MENLTETNTPLTKTKKILIAFFISYLFFYMFPFPTEFIPPLAAIFSFYIDFISEVNVWVGNHLLGMSFSTEMNGSGDTTSEYVKIITNCLLALVVGMALFFFVKKEKNFLRLKDWIFTYARYYVGLFMIVYGFAKLFDGQFREPGVFQLEHTYGDSSPMNLLWTFMGYSKAYTWFSGIGETIAGVLLLFRRTTAIGSIMTIFIMVNVLMLNMCYDVPVKLFSGHLVLITLLILAPDMKRLVDLFIFGKATGLVVTKFELPKRWMRITRIALKSLLMALLVFSFVFSQFIDERDAAPHDLVGVYKTDIFKVENDTLAPLSTDTVRWNKMIIGWESARIITMADSTEYYEVAIDQRNKKINLNSYDDTTKAISLTYANLPQNRFLLSGIYKGKSISVQFKKKETKDYLLMNRGFHWVNEYPFNK